MPLLYLLAENTFSESPGSIVAAVLAIAVAFTTFGAISITLARGFWASRIEPMIQLAITQWYTSEPQTRTRRETVEQIIATWHASQPQVSARTTETMNSVAISEASAEAQLRKRTFIREEIENQVRRDDGIIHREINLRVERGIQPLQDGMEQIRALLQQRQAADAEFREEVLARLGHLTGVISPRHEDAAPPHSVSRPPHPLQTLHPISPRTPAKPPTKG